jgi:hypothetical protein
MKVKLPLALVVVLAIALGYLVGTDSGRNRRDLILVKIGRADKDAGGANAGAAIDASDQTPDSEADTDPSA